MSKAFAVSDEDLARQAIIEFMTTRNLDPAEPSTNEIVLMAWKLAGVTGIPIHKARLLIARALKYINESNSSRSSAISP